MRVLKDKYTLRGEKIKESHLAKSNLTLLVSKEKYGWVNQNCKNVKGLNRLK